MEGGLFITALPLEEDEKCKASYQDVWLDLKRPKSAFNFAPVKLRYIPGKNWRSLYNGSLRIWDNRSYACSKMA
jgi:hypothetical protein